MNKLNYRKYLTTETNEEIGVATYDNDSNIYITLLDMDGDCACVALTRKEAQRVKRYLEDAITANIVNWEENNGTI